MTTAKRKTKVKIETQDYNDVTVVSLQGEFSAESNKAFQDLITSVVASGAVGIVLDMSEVVFIDSPSLEQLLWLCDYCQENTRRLKIAGLDEYCAKILEITRLASKFDIYEELSQAVKSVV